MSPILNPTAPAFSPPVQIPRLLASPFISTTSIPYNNTRAASELALEEEEMFDWDLELALDADLNDPGSSNSDDDDDNDDNDKKMSSQLAIALLGESLLKAVFQSPSSPYSPVDEDDQVGDQQRFPLSPPTTTTTSSSSSTPVSDRSVIWSPTAFSSSASEAVHSPVSSVLSLSDEETTTRYCAAERHEEDLTSSPNEMCWEANQDCSHDNGIYLGQNTSSPRPPIIIGALRATTPEVPPLKFGIKTRNTIAAATDNKNNNNTWPSAENFPSTTMQQQLSSSWPQPTAVYPGTSFAYFSPQLLLQSPSTIAPSFQFIHVPSPPPPPPPQVYTPRIRLAPLWPLLSALHRNLSRSRPDIYGSLQPSTYFTPEFWR